ncbi:hypothetical protein O5558_20355 [Escherichia coli]|nr:hypothetical protein [Escherichia coli]
MPTSPEALASTVARIAKRCNVTVRLGEILPAAVPDRGHEHRRLSGQACKEGLEERRSLLFPDEEERLKRRPEYDGRLETELRVISQMGFPATSSSLWNSSSGRR